MSDQEVGSAQIVEPSDSSDSQPSELSSSSSSTPSPALVATGFITSMTGIAGILYVWICTSKLDRAPWWGPLAALAVVMIPGGVLGHELGSTARVVVRQPLSKLLGKSNNPDRSK